MPQSLEQLIKKESQLKEQIKDLKAKRRKAERKQDAHNKIVVGATIMAAVPDLDLTDEAVRNAFCNFIRNQHQNGWIGKWIDRELAKATKVEDKPEGEPSPSYRHASVDEVDRILGVGLFDDDDDEIGVEEDPGIDDDD